MLIDFHTHKPSPDIHCIESLSLNDQPSDYLFTYGLHPWYLNQMDFSDFSQRFAKLRLHPKFLALGEAGLDRACNVDFELQKEVFLGQLNLAHHYKIDVVIIHCVRALNDIFQVLKQSTYKGKLVFHDANFNQQELNQILEQGHYLSLGQNLLKPGSKATQSFSSISIERIFLESDDSEINISDLYQHAAKLLNIKSSSLELQILKNFQHLFARSINP